MLTIDMTNPLIMLIALLINVLCIILGKEFKKSAIPAISLFLFLGLILLHGIQIVMIGGGSPILTKSLAYDAIMILLSYISYLWVDDIEARAKNRKSIDNSLDWFWKKV